MKKMLTSNENAKQCETKLQGCLQSLLDLKVASVTQPNRIVAVCDDTRLLCEQFANVYAANPDLVEDVNPINVKGVEVSLPDMFVRNTDNMIRCFAFPMFKPTLILERPSVLLLFMFGRVGKQQHVAAYAEIPNVELSILIVRTCESLARLGSFLDSNLVAPATSTDAECLLEQLRANDLHWYDEEDEDFDLDANPGKEEDGDDEEEDEEEFDEDDEDDDITR